MQYGTEGNFEFCLQRLFVPLQSLYVMTLCDYSENFSWLFLLQAQHSGHDQAQPSIKKGNNAHTQKRPRAPFGKQSSDILCKMPSCEFNVKLLRTPNSALNQCLNALYVASFIASLHVPTETVLFGVSTLQLCKANINHFTH